MPGIVGGGRRSGALAGRGEALRLAASGRASGRLFGSGLAGNIVIPPSVLELAGLLAGEGSVVGALETPFYPLSAQLNGEGSMIANLVFGRWEYLQQYGGPELAVRLGRTGLNPDSFHVFNQVSGSSPELGSAGGTMSPSGSPSQGNLRNDFGDPVKCIELLNSGTPKMAMASAATNNVTTGSFAALWVGDVADTVGCLLSKADNGGQRVGWFLYRGSATISFAVDFGATAFDTQVTLDGVLVSRPIIALGVYDVPAATCFLYIWDFATGTIRISANSGLGAHTSISNVGIYGIGAGAQLAPCEAAHVAAAFFTGANAEGLNSTHLRAFGEWAGEHTWPVTSWGDITTRAAVATKMGTSLPPTAAWLFNAASGQQSDVEGGFPLTPTTMLAQNDNDRQLGGATARFTDNSSASRMAAADSTVFSGVAAGEFAVLGVLQINGAVASRGVVARLSGSTGWQCHFVSAVGELRITTANGSQLATTSGLAAATGDVLVFIAGKQSDGKLYIHVRKAGVTYSAFSAGAATITDATSIFRFGATGFINSIDLNLRFGAIWMPTEASGLGAVAAAAVATFMTNIGLG